MSKKGSRFCGEKYIETKLAISQISHCVVGLSIMGSYLGQYLAYLFFNSTLLYLCAAASKLCVCNLVTTAPPPPDTRFIYFGSVLPRNFLYHKVFG